MAKFKMVVEYTIWISDCIFGGERVFEKTTDEERKDEIAKILCDSGKVVIVTTAKKRMKVG